MTNTNVKFPISYYCPKIPKGTLRWICGKDEEGKIIGIIVHGDEEGHVESFPTLLENEQTVESCINALKQDGWLELKRPEIVLHLDQ